MRSITFTVPGEPRPKGSHRAFMMGWKPGATIKPKVVMAPNSKHEKPWQKKVRKYATIAMAPEPQRLRGPISLIFVFMIERPATHFVANDRKREIKERFKAELPCRTPDVDKLIRAATDPMNGVVYDDDKQVITTAGVKLYGRKPGVTIIARELGFDARAEGGELDGIEKEPEQLLLGLEGF